MLTAVERVLILKGADLLRDVGPRQLFELAKVTREVELTAGDAIFEEDDAADALYMMVDGRVRLSTRDKTNSEVGPGETFGTWAIVDDAPRGQRAECIEDGMALALHRDAFYDVAAGDLTLLKEVVRALARRLRELVSERPGEARVEGEGVEMTEAMSPTKSAPRGSAPDVEAKPTRGTSLSRAALGQESTEAQPAQSPSRHAIPTAEAERRAGKPESPPRSS